MLPKKKGFTLIELLVVVSIIGLIMAIAVFSFDEITSNARNNKRIGDIKQIQLALEDYYKDYGDYPATISFGSSLNNESNTKTYLATIPTNPKPWSEQGCPNTDYEYYYDASAGYYLLSFCLGKKSGDFSAGEKCATPNKLYEENCQSLTLAFHPLDHLIAGYKFDADADDFSTNDHDGTIDGATFVTGKGGNALSFNRVNDDYVLLPPSNEILSSYPFSVSVWIKTTTQHGTYGTEGRIINFFRPTASSAFALYIGGAYPSGGTSNQINLLWNSVSNTFTNLAYATPSPYVYNGEWHHLCATHSGTAVKLYYDGVEVASNNSTGFTSFGTDNARIGTWNGIDRSFDGLIDEPMIFDVVLSPTDVQNIYQGLKFLEY